MTDVEFCLRYWKHWREDPYCYGTCKDPHELFLQVATKKLPPDVFRVSRWTEEHVYDWTHFNDLCVWGCASSSKSYDFGHLAYVDWSIDPFTTVTLMASTSREDLMDRTFSSVVKFHHVYERLGLGFVGKLADSGRSVVIDYGKLEGRIDLPPPDPKMGIWGVAIREGPIQQAVGRIRGRHAPYVRFVCDELSVMHPAVMSKDLFANLRIGNAKDGFKFVGLTNIESFNDLAGQHSTPKQGYDSITIDTEVWETNTGGRVRRHDGFKSPAITEEGGADKYPHLLNQSTLDDIIRENHGNAQAPAVCRMIRAFPPASGVMDTVISEVEAANWKVTRPEPIWVRHIGWVAALDPGYGRDDCVLQFARVGAEKDGGFVVYYGTENLHYIPVDSGNTQVTLSDQIYNGCLPFLKEKGITPKTLVIDDSATQSVADYFCKLFGAGVLRVSNGAAPSEKAISKYDQTPAKNAYADRATELAFSLRQYASYGQIAGLPDAALRQFTSRLVQRPRRASGKRTLQSKDEYKKATGRGSPGEMDVALMALAVVRDRLLIVPGANEFEPQGPTVAWHGGTFYDAAVRMNNAFGRL